MDKFYDKFEGRTFNQTPEDGKWYVVGDLHGRYDQLMDNLDEIGFDFDADKLFAVGDLIDRGPKSWECLMLTYEPWFHSVLGNHEQMAYDCLIREDFHNYHMWTENGGLWYYEDGHRKYDSHKQEMLEIITSLPNIITLTIGDNKVGIVHASAGHDSVWPPNQTSISHYAEQTIWSRKALSGFMPKVAGVDLLITGHNPVDKIRLDNNVLMIDTGYPTGKLSLINIEDYL